ncbi:hypothetical protein KI387_028201, partial [Taxus chinensis]
MSAHGGSEDLYAVLSAHYPYLLNSTPKEKQQVVSKKRSWDSAIIPSMQLELELDNQYPASLNTICSEREIHIWSERSRRKKMSYMLNTLLSLLPAHGHLKVDKLRVIEEAINYIKILQGTLKDLQARKSETEASLKASSFSVMQSKESHQVCDVQIPLSLTMAPTSSLKILGSNVVGNHAFTTIWATQQTGFLPKLIFILDINQLEIVDCTINTDGCSTFYTLHVMHLAMVPSISVSGNYKVLLHRAVIVVPCTVALFILGLHIYVQYFWLPRRLRGSFRRRDLEFTGGENPTMLHTVGLEKWVIETLPVFVFRAENDKDKEGLECGIRLCEFEEKEMARLLPKCRHSFHIDCID